MRYTEKPGLIPIAVDDQLQRPALTSHRSRRRELRFGRQFPFKLRPEPSELRSRFIGIGRQYRLALIHHGEPVDQALEFADQMRRHEHRPLPRCRILIGPDHRLDELASDQRIQSRGRLIEHQHLGLRRDRPDQGELRSLSLAQTRRRCRGIQLELVQQGRFQFPVPMPSEARLIIQRFADTHPRIERDEVRHIGQARLHRRLLPLRIEAEHPHGPDVRSQQVEQAFDRGRLPGAVAAAESVALARLHCE